MTNPSHTKDFKEAAEKHASTQTGGGWPDYNICMEDFTAGANHGYAEAMKEQREEIIALKNALIDIKQEVYEGGNPYTIERIIKKALKHNKNNLNTTPNERYPN